jgi:hypothetical protein
MRIPKFCEKCGLKLKIEHYERGFNKYTGKPLIDKVAVCPKKKRYGFINNTDLIVSSNNHSIFTINKERN